MAHHHHHDHHHGPVDPGRLNRAFLIGIGLNLLFVLIETGAGFATGSLALLTDAGHNLSDVGSLALSLLAFRLAHVRTSERFSYGYQKSTVLASLINGVILLMLVGGIGYEALRRLSEPPQVPGMTVAVVAAAGILVNGLSAWLFHRDREQDLNVKGAYLHLAADAAVSAGVVAAGLAMYWTGWRWLDPAISFLILGVILWSSWGLLKESISLTLDAVPEKIDLKKIRAVALRIEGVKDIHHIHVWAMSTIENALTAHLVLEEGLSGDQVQALKKHFRHELEHLNIRHATLETEGEMEECANKECGD
ncbi:MAG: cation transporter [Haliscomenobacteraceae bacterium CHB4]|nr:Cadmium, cobalt and zinc/H(+)-K(+) antiporter [Saprospiraceae bacterium]MCE7922909.1 cation transporter [Haliscomenobacteraceae bacterium CHB4]